MYRERNLHKDYMFFFFFNLDLEISWQVKKDGRFKEGQYNEGTVYVCISFVSTY